MTSRTDDDYRIVDIGTQSSLEPIAGGDPQFIDEISPLADLQETLDSGSIWVAITIASDGTVAREVEIRASGRCRGVD